MGRQKHFTYVNEKSRWSMKYVDIAGKMSLQIEGEP
jgi:hypothetical protein